MSAEDGPEGGDDVGDEGGAVIVSEAWRDFGDGIGVQQAVFLEAALVVAALQVVGLAEYVVAYLQGGRGVGAEFLDDTGHVVAEDHGEAVFDKGTPVTDFEVIGVY